MTLAPNPTPGPMPPLLDLPADASDILDPRDFDCVAHTVQDNNPGMEADLARRITREALKFVITVGLNPSRAMAPSRVVDEGWHALILHTKVYEQLCARLGGFVHHYPERPDPSRFNGTVLMFTTSMMETAGYPADTRLWGNPTTGDIVVAASCQHSPPDCQVTCMNKPGR